MDTRCTFLHIHRDILLFSLLVAKIRRTESVPSDINNPVDRPAEAPQFGTLPKAITKKVKVHYNAEYHFIVRLLNSCKSLHLDINYVNP